MIPYELQNTRQEDWDTHYPLNKILHTLIETMGCQTRRLE